MELWDTIPTWHSNNEFDILPRDHKVFLRVLFTFVHRSIVAELEADLTEYYKWAEENDIVMCHSLLRQGELDYNRGFPEGLGLICFAFPDQTHAMAFKLRWT